MNFMMYRFYNKLQHNTKKSLDLTNPPLPHMSLSAILGNLIDVLRRGMLNTYDVDVIQFH